jgi:TorA maturation chaperone TorD
VSIADETEGAEGAERARICGFLAGVFCSAPTAESARSLSRMALASGIGCPDGLSLADLDRDFTDLFVVPNPRYVAPYESVYRDSRLLPLEPGQDATPQTIGRLLMGESTAAMRQCFLEAGVLPSQDLPDHFGNELQLLSHLCVEEDQRPGRQASGRALRTKVLNEHLLKWIGPLRQKVSENERVGFYSAALDLVGVVLRSDPLCAIPARPGHFPEDSGAGDLGRLRRA